MGGVVVSSNWPVRTAQKNAARKPAATRPPAVMPWKPLPFTEPAVLTFWIKPDALLFATSRPSVWPLLDAFTGLIGSGPAYLYLVAEALIDAGVLVGLPRPAARAMVTQLIAGSAKLLVETGELPEVLRANVTSPGGTTAAGLRELEQEVSGTRRQLHGVIDAIDAVLGPRLADAEA